MSARQMMWERKELLEALKCYDVTFADYADKKVREDFRARYGRSWL